MDTGVIIALILGAASIFSSISFGIIPNIRRRKLEKLEKKIQKMAQDIDSFYAIEQSLLEQLSSATGKKVKALKDDTRKKCEDRERSASQRICYTKWNCIRIIGASTGIGSFDKYW